MTRKKALAWIVGGLLLGTVGAVLVIAVSRSMDLPPSDGQSLAAIVESVERKGVGVIQSIEYERDWWKSTGLWEITACTEKNCFKLYIDPRTGEETRRKSDDLEDELPPPNMHGPAAIAKAFEDSKSGFITEIEFEHGAWQVKFRETRGLAGALQPTKRRVFEPTRISRNPHSWGPA